jgi:hypothetical protein
MGYSCRWIGTRGIDRADVLRQLGFSVTAELSEEVFDPGLYAVQIDAWFVVIGDGRDHMDLVTRDHAAKLSERGDALFVFTTDTAMCAEITAFAEGAMAWSILYDGSNGVTKPELFGRPPDEAREVMVAAYVRQDEEGGASAGVDHVYDIPAEVGLRLVGFRHDETLGGGKHLPVYELSPQ